MTEAGLEEKVKKAIDEIRPRLQADGGDLGYVGMDDGIVKVKLQGSCAGCPFSQMTLKNFIEKELRKDVSGVKGVESV